MHKYSHTGNRLHQTDSIHLWFIWDIEHIYTSYDQYFISKIYYIRLNLLRLVMFFWIKHIFILTWVINLPTTPSNIFFKLLTFSLQLWPTSVLILEFHDVEKYSGAIWVSASAIATPSDNSVNSQTPSKHFHFSYNIKVITIRKF